MTDVTTNTASTTAAIPEQPTNTPALATEAAVAPKTGDKSTKPKSKPKRRTRQRRRAATSDNDSSANEGGDQSDSSASSHSDHADSEDEEEPEVIESKPSVFPDVSSITPAGWTKKDENQESISFEDFEAGKEPPAAVPNRGTGLAIRGRGKGKVEAGQKREYTPEETARYEAQKAKRKEKLKAKKAELREKAIKEKEAKAKEAPKAAQADTLAKEHPAPVGEKPTVQPTAKPTPAQPPKHKAKKQTESAPTLSNSVAEVTASTSALKLDDSAPTTAQSADAVEPAETAPPKAENDETAVESQRGVELLPNAASASEDPADRTQRGPRGNQREAYAQRMAEDPKFTPRVGQFWTHDQRLYEGGNVGDGYSGLRQMSPFWRGRAMPRGAFRGGMRGRGRGGFFPNGRGGFVNMNGGPPRPVELSQEEPKEEGGSKLAMDREFELAEAREKARSTTQASVPIESPGNEAAMPVVRPPVAPMAERKWGHEAFETMGSGDQFRGGRGRGRVMRARGGHFPRVHHLPFHPSAIAAQNAAAARAAALAAASTPPATAVPAPAPATESAPPAQKTEEPAGETMATQPDAESLLDTGDDSFKVKFPGQQATVVPSAPSASTVPPTAPDSTTSATPASASAAPVTVAKEVSHEAQYPTLHSSSPGPVAAFQAQMYTGGSSNSPFPNGSENGSVGSGHFARHPGQFYAPGMNASGEFVPSHMQPHPQQQSPQHQYQPQPRPPFHPQSRQPIPPQAYSPQFHPSSPYSPGPYDSHAGPSYAGSPGPGGPPMASPQGGFYPGQANGYANGRSSPLNPYMGNNHVGGYFSPARSASKVAIRAPRPGQDSEGEGQGQGQSNGTPPQANGQQPQQQQGGAYYPQHYNPYVQPFVPGQYQQQRQETVYYPTPNDQQFGWQGYGEQGYYDANGAYGY